MILTIINYISKIAFGFSFSISSLAIVEQNFTQGDFFTNILNQIPSMIAVILGVSYGVIIVFGRASKEWKQHKLNIQEVKKGEEKVEQEEIITNQKRKELKNSIK
jgi:hypothetical protein